MVVCLYCGIHWARIQTGEFGIQKGDSEAIQGTDCALSLSLSLSLSLLLFTLCVIDSLSWFHENVRFFFIEI